MTIKRIIALLTTLIIIFTAFSSCKNNQVDNSTDSSESSSASDEIRDTNVTLCANGQSDYKIVIPKEADVTHNTAANEIANYIKLSTGADMEVVSDDGASDASFNGGKFISVGKTAMFNAQSIKLPDEGEDSFVIKTIGESVYICGRNLRGNIYGAFEFLTKEIGYEVFKADEIYYDVHSELKLKDFNVERIPYFNTRYMDGMGHSQRDTATRLYIDPWRGTDKFGEPIEVDWIPNAYHTITELVGDHTELIQTTQMCFTNEDVLDAIVEGMCKAIPENPDGYILNVSQEDGKTYCRCKNCSEEISRYKVSGYWIRFMNKFVDKMEVWIAENCPDRQFIYSTFAYGETVWAPTVTNADGTFSPIDPSCVPRDKLYIRLTPGQNCRFHALDDETCEDNVNYLKNDLAWRSLTSNLQIWDYAAAYHNYLIFFPDKGLVQTKIQFYVEKLGVRDVFIEANSGGSLTAFANYRLYLYGKLLWDPYQDVEVLTDRFFEQYYKECAPQMRELFDMYMTHLQNVNIHEYHSKKDANMFPRNIVDRAEELVNEALAVCNAMDDTVVAQKIKNRCFDELYCIHLTKICFYSAYGYPLDEYKDFYNLFVSEMEDANMPRYSERVSMSEFLDSIKPKS